MNLLSDVDITASDTKKNRGYGKCRAGSEFSCRVVAYLDILHGKGP